MPSSTRHQLHLSTSKPSEWKTCPTPTLSTKFAPKCSAKVERCAGSCNLLWWSTHTHEWWRHPDSFYAWAQENNPVHKPLLLACWPSGVFQVAFQNSKGFLLACLNSRLLSHHSKIPHYERKRIKLRQILSLHWWSVQSDNQDSANQRHYSCWIG